MKSTTRFLACLAVLSIGTLGSPRCRASHIAATLQTLTPTSIAEGDTVLFDSYFQTTASGTHIGSGSANYVPGGPATRLGGPASFSLPHGSTYYSPTTTLFRYLDDGTFLATLGGGASTHDSNHRSLTSVSFSNLVSARRTITVRNVAPTIDSLTGDLAVETGASFAFSASASDPGVRDVLTFDWDLNNDGNFGDFTGPSGTFSFSSPGLHPVSVLVSDGDGGVARGTFNVQATTPAPEPTSLALLGTAAIALVGYGWGRKRSENVKDTHAA